MKNIVLLLFLNIGAIYGQGISEYTSLTQLYSQEQANPDIAKAMAAMEEGLSSVSLDTSSLLNALPVVFHIIYSDKSSKPPVEEITNVLTVLNAAFYGNELPSDHPSIQSGYSKTFADIGLRFAINTDIEGYNYYQDSTYWTGGMSIQGKYPPVDPACR